MTLDENLKNKIVSRIMEKYKVKDIILFGSYALGNATKDSDLDLVIVLDESGCSKDYEEMLQKRLKISRLFFDIKKNISMDILVYTNDEWNKLISLNSSFIRNINNKGVKIK